jgi:oligopeptide transport system ATP-binding protein
MSRSSLADVRSPDGAAQPEPLVRVEDLKVYFPSRGTGFLGLAKGPPVRAVDGISLAIGPGETLGLVGESGCGKSTTGRAILQLAKPTAGAVYFEGRNLVGLPERARWGFRRNAQIIFQDPYSALDPRMTIGHTIAEPLRIHRIVPPSEIRDRVRELLRTVGLNPGFVNRYPHEFSGGQQQRIGIARALAVEPAFIVCDEPISALDVSIQAQIVNLLVDLQETKRIAYLFIAHDLRVVRLISSRVAVMYLGKIVELAESDELYDNPLHPYTRALMSAVPTTDPDHEDRRIYAPLGGEVPSPLNPPSGCRFRTRCPLAQSACADVIPELREIRPGHLAACHFA